MKLYHQCGHRFVWNIDSLRKDRAGDGLIVSPVNIPMEKLAEKINAGIRATSIFDPQFYRPHDAKKHLKTYPFHPANVVESFDTDDFGQHASDVAEKCVSFQVGQGFSHVTIPTRYFEELPDDHFDQVAALFRDPFVEAWQRIADAPPLLLTLFAKGQHLRDADARDELLTWATSLAEISAVYLIFENNFSSKQIKNPEYLAGALHMIHDLRQAGMRVHVGYSDVEALLYAAADPTAVAMGSYENLRAFEIRRLETQEKGTQRSPRARVYSGRLLQWIEDSALPAMKRLLPDWTEYFDPSPYRDGLLANYDGLHFGQGDLYKHYFFIMNEQVRGMSESGEQNRARIRTMVQSAMKCFAQIREAGITLDPDSDGSHLAVWLNALAMFEADLVDDDS